MTAKLKLADKQETKKAFGMSRAAGGWCFVTLEYTWPDMKVTSFVETPPDMRAVSFEAFKIAVAKHVQDLENGKA